MRQHFGEGSVIGVLCMLRAPFHRDSEDSLMYNTFRIV